MPIAYDHRETGPQTPVRALQRGLTVLDCFAGEEALLTLTDIAERTGLSLPTALRILNTLEAAGYVRRSSYNKRYSLGDRLLRLLASASLTAPGLREAALPFMRELHAAFDESVTLYIPAGTCRVCIERLESSRTLRTTIAVGQQLPMALGAGGRALAAWLAPHELETLKAANPLLDFEKLAATRRDGYAVSHGEREEGISAVAAPVRNSDNSVQASLSIAGPTTRFTPEVIRCMVEEVTRAARDISRRQGWWGSSDE